MSSAEHAVPVASTPLERTKVNLSWLHKLRWAAIGGQLITIAVVAGLMGIELPLARLLAIVALAAATNVCVGVWLQRRNASAPLR
ncbi:MAG TPA: hypothetical protein VG713_15230, partial [Pirellulales bacterium]|nr:hypothetical protein [Pirellulales bacterium]